MAIVHPFPELGGPELAHTLALPSPDAMPSALRREARLAAHAAMRAAGIAIAPRNQHAFTVAIDSAAVESYERGQETGYVQGWRWGAICGAALGATAVGLALALGAMAGGLQP